MKTKEIMEAMGNSKVRKRGWEFSEMLLKQYPRNDDAWHLAAERVGFRFSRLVKLHKLNAPDSIIMAEVENVASALVALDLLKPALSDAI